MSDNVMATNKVVLFDFDGTISTLRAGWEEIMAPFMKESIIGFYHPTEVEDQVLEQEISDYIDQSTGIQTVFQMGWLAEQVRKKGWNQQVQDEWDYKAEYNRRLLIKVKERIRRLEQDELQAEDYLMKGSLVFLRRLQEHGVEMYVASGTDHPDVVREAEVLGVASYFKEIVGAPVGKAECSKEKVIKDLIEWKGLSGSDLVVIGDGKVEIRLAKEYGGLALGLASDEEKREGINPVKQRRLLEAGADWIEGDFQEINTWLLRLGL